jgi:hypothetical protein
MATRVALTKTALPGPYNYTGVELDFTAADPVNKERFPLTGKEIVLAWNTAAVASSTVTISAVADPYGRTRSVDAVTVAATKIFAFGPFTNRTGWLQADGNMYLEASVAEVEFAVLTLP